MKNFIQRIKILIRWFPILLNDYDWDYWFTYQILKTKLKHQSDYFKKHGITEDAKHCADRIDLCIRLLEKVQNEEYMDLPKDKPWTIEMINASIEKHNKARKLLFKILEQNIERFWD